MSRTKLGAAVATTAISLMVVAGACSTPKGAKSKKDGAKGVENSTFSDDAKLCGSYASISGISPGTGPQAQYSKIALAHAETVCGGSEGEKRSNWEALAMTTKTDVVHIASLGATDFTGSEKDSASLYVAQDLTVLAIKADGTSIVVGKVDELEYGAVIDPAAGVTLDLFIKGESYELGKFDKNMPDEDRTVWVKGVL